MTRRPDPRLLAAARLIENLAARLPLAREHTVTQVSAIDGIGSVTVGADLGTGGHTERTIRVLITGDDGEPTLDVNGREQYDDVPVTAVEDYALRRTHLLATLADLEAHAAAIATIAANALNDCDRIIGKRLPVTVPHCDGRGLEGYELPRQPDGWSDPACYRSVDKAGLCSACYQRCRRWRLRMGLRPLQNEGEVA